MFGLFGRKRIESWEKQLFSNVFKKLGSQYEKYYDQINADIWDSVRIERTEGQTRVSFTFSPKASRFEDRRCPVFALKNIKVFETISNKEVAMDLYIVGDLVSFYVILSDLKKFAFNPNEVDINDCYRDDFDDSELGKVESLLKMKLRDVLNSEDIYIVTVLGKEIYHLKDLEDGDFLGVDLNGRLLKVTHDLLCLEEVKGHPGEVL